MDLPQLIEALSRPEAYPHPAGVVEVRQTHISVVFLAGDFVYKLKKPVAPGFLDFTTLDKRLHFCREEVRLNRRLAPDVYLGVVPVVRAADGLRFDGEGEPVEWAVKMRRLPDGATLLDRVRRDEASPELVAALARRVAAFHRAADANARTAACGRFEVVAKNVADVLARAAACVGPVVSEAVFDRTRELFEARLAHLRPLIDSRAARGVPVDGHGDLHLDHVYCFPDRPPPDDLCVIDCIEFNEQFRFLDPVADAAFAVMDLAFHGRRDLGRHFAAAYFNATGDAEGRELLPLYTAYRAAVRGMVDGLLTTEPEVPAAEREAAVARGRGHWLLALAELEDPGRRPCLLLVGGLPGSGKSTLARGLAERAGFAVIRSDVVRKELANLPAHEPSPAGARAALYSTGATERTYAECLTRARNVLRDGGRVIVDATFRGEHARRQFLDLATEYGVPVGVLVCEARPEAVRARLAERTGDASDADWEVYTRAAAQWEHPGPSVQRVLHATPTDGPPADALARGLDALRDLGVAPR
jgi:aminoglycoside phosphotransferase family enzyme/predicted kinase